MKYILNVYMDKKNIYKLVVKICFTHLLSITGKHFVVKHFYRSKCKMSVFHISYVVLVSLSRMIQPVTEITL